MIVLLLIWACTGDDTRSPPVDSSSEPTEETASTADTGETKVVDPNSLEALGLLEWDGIVFTYAGGVEPYRLATPLFSDFAVKERAVQLPEGTSATFTESGVLDFPVGTTLIKSFLFPADLRQPDQDLRLIETRVLTLEEDGWDAWPYVWNDEQTSAVRAPGGAVRNVSFLDESGKEVSFVYPVPQRNQCDGCHAVLVKGDSVTVPIGPSARNLHVGGQLQSLIDAGVVSGSPDLAKVDRAWDWSTVSLAGIAKMSDEDVTHAARDYLDVNCAHCHNPEGSEGVSSQFWLNYDNEDAFRFGVCKRPGSAGPGSGGLTFDIVPGNPDESILLFRTETTDLEALMPALGRSLTHELGVAVVREWIARMPGDCEDK